MCNISKRRVTKFVFTDLSKTELVKWLKESDESKLEELWQAADETRKRFVGDEVHLRGLIEVSNYCSRLCAYCGIRFGNRAIERYRMTEKEIIESVYKAVDFGYGTVVLQSGEDRALTTDFITSLIRRIKSETELAVTLSLGERSELELAEWRQAGADRYLLRFETSDPMLYGAIHPGQGGRPGRVDDRLSLLSKLKAFGFEAGSGIMIGIPGQSYESIASDLLLFKELDLDMIGVGPYIPHPDTPLGNFATKKVESINTDSEGQETNIRNGKLNFFRLPSSEQVPPTELMTYKVVALTRLVCPEVNIPSTTALATLNTETGRELGLQRGANIVMPNITPLKYRKLYEIYPAKACVSETAEMCNICLTGRLVSIGRTTGHGKGGRVRNEHNR